MLIYICLKCHSMFPGNKGLDSPVVGKVKHRSQCFIYRHCCQSFSESEAAMFMKVSCGACEQFTVPLEA